jgi:hypothetical protein
MPDRPDVEIFLGSNVGLQKRVMQVPKEEKVDFSKTAVFLTGLTISELSNALEKVVGDRSQGLVKFGDCTDGRRTQSPFNKADIGGLKIG